MQRRRRYRLFGRSADGRTHGLGPPHDGCFGVSNRYPNGWSARPQPRTNGNAARNIDPDGNPNAASYGDAALVRRAVGHAVRQTDFDAEADCVGIRDAERREHDAVFPSIPAHHAAVKSLVHHVIRKSDASGVE